MDRERFPVGIIGLGPLGMAFAEILMKQGIPVIGYRRSGMDEFIAAGGIGAASPADLVQRAEVVLDCLPHEDALLTLFDGEFSIMEAIRPGQALVSLAGHSLANKQRLADLVAEQGGVVLDSVVSGSTDIAKSGQAPITISGDSEATAALTPLLSKLTSQLSYVGDFGEATRKSVGMEGRV
jgi:L-threonate 2-dehydrogenase